MSMPPQNEKEASDEQQATVPDTTGGQPNLQQVNSDSDSEDSQNSETHGPYVVGDYVMGFEFQVPWDQAPPGTTWVPGRVRGEYRLVPLHQGGVLAPHT